MTPEQQEYWQTICYLGLSTFLTIAAITIAIVLLRKRGMKSKSKICLICGYDCGMPILYPQEKNNPTTTKENEE